MSETSVGLEFLFARLAHPEGMVRERACAAKARLLNTNDTAEATRERLASWTKGQRLESIAVFALLIWIRARIDNPGIELPDSHDIVKSFPRPSLLSWLLLRELHGVDCPEPAWQCTFSEGLRRDFEPDPFFLRHAIHFVPPIYAETANRIARETRSPFVNQWAWEWDCVVEQLSVVPDEHVLRSRGDTDSDLHVCYDFKLSEIYRSAYLRTLSWAMFNGIVDQSDAQMHAAKCCPIDVGLWQVALDRCPDWWPTVSKSGNKLDESVGLVMERLKELFREQAKSKVGWSLAQASGLIEGENVHIELEIYGVFQKCLGPSEPEVGEVGRGFRWDVEDLLAFESWIKFSGRVIPWPDSSHVVKEGDWELTPAFTRIDSPVAGRWQWWRHYRQIWAPALCLVDGCLNITIEDDGISYDHESSPVGRWTDWSWGLRETRDANLPPATGQALFVKGEYLEAFSDINKCSFCWIWLMTGYHRRDNWGKYDTFTFQGNLGTTGICKA